MRVFATKLQRVACGLAAGLLYSASISAAPVALVMHRHASSFFTDQSLARWGFYILCSIASSSAFIHVFLSRDKSAEKFAIAHYLFEFGASAFLFWYTASAALCEKLSVCTIQSSFQNLYENFGFALIASAAFLIIKVSFFRSNGLAKAFLVRHPIYGACFLHMIGIAFLFDTWFPLPAIPGALICLKWHCQSDNTADNGRSYRFQVVPFLF